MGDKNGNEICKLNIHYQKTHNRCISADGTTAVTISASKIIVAIKIMTKQ